MSPYLLEPGLKITKINYYLLFHPDCYRRFWIFTKSTLIRARGLIISKSPPVENSTPPRVNINKYINHV